MLHSGDLICEGTIKAGKTLEAVNDGATAAVPYTADSKENSAAQTGPSAKEVYPEVQSTGDDHAPANSNLEHVPTHGEEARPAMPEHGLPPSNPEVEEAVSPKTSSCVVLPRML